MSKFEKGPPALMFFGQLIKITTTIPAPLSEDDAMPEGVMPAMAITGIMLDSDDIYITLGGVTTDGEPVLRMAVKHADIITIEVYDPDEDNDTLQRTDGTIN
jgi:hypothetical protein